MMFNGSVILSPDTTITKKVQPSLNEDTGTIVSTERYIIYTKCSKRSTLRNNIMKIENDHQADETCRRAASLPSGTCRRGDNHPGPCVDQETVDRCDDESAGETEFPTLPGVHHQ